jgi:hypothetical protein
MLEGKFQLNLSYASSIPEQPWANFGDSLNPILLHLLTEMAVKHTNFDEDVNRLSAIGTILQDFSNGTLDVWGTGLDVTKTTIKPLLNHFNPLKTNVDYKVHAVRGLVTDTVLKGFGIRTNGVFGDPAILLKRMLKSYVGSEKNGKIGVICHLSELSRYDDTAGAHNYLARYHFETDEIKLISTIVKPEPIAILEKIKEIASYSYILSASLHGLIVADIFNTPCAHLASENFQHGRYSIFDYRSVVDHRFRDYYSGMREVTLPVYFAPVDGKIHPLEVINFLESHWRPLSFVDDIAEELIASFPLRTPGFRDHHVFPEYLWQLTL